MKNNRNCTKCYWEQFFTSNPEDDVYCAKCKDFSMWKSKTITPKEKIILDTNVKIAREAIKLCIDYISLTQGWEETGDIYRKHFGIPIKYPKK